MHIYILRGGLWISVGLTFVCVWRSEDNHRYLRVPSTFCWRQGVSLAWTFTMLARLVGTACVCLPYNQSWDYRHMLSCLSFYVLSGDLNSGPHACKASIPPSEPSPKLHGSLTKDTFNWPPWSSLEVIKIDQFWSLLSHFKNYYCPILGIINLCQYN